MVAKNQRKKQVATAFLKNRDVVRFTLQDFHMTDLESKLKDGNDIVKLIKGLMNAQSLEEQIKLIQFLKGTIRQYLSSATIPDSQTEFSLYAKLLLQLYILPVFFPLRNSLEWISESLNHIKCLSKDEIRTIIKTISEDTWRICINSGALSNVSEKSNANDLMGWTFTINYLCMLEKDYLWIDREPANQPLSSEGMLFQLISFIAGVFVGCANIVAPADKVSSSSSSEVIRYAECCGESMRAVVTLLKTHRTAFVGLDGPWLDLVHTVMKCSTRVLASDVVNKDVVTSTAMGVVCLQWLIRNLDHRNASQHLMSFVTLCNLGEQELPSEDMIRVGGLHVELRTAVPSLPIVSRCAILRACLSIYDDNSMLSRGLNYRSDSILFGPLFNSIMVAANHSLSVTRLYGLQTLESWLNRVEVVLNSGSASADASDLMSRFLSVAEMLTGAWNHPSRQVNHIVPTIYSRLIHLINTCVVARDPWIDKVALWNPLVQQSLVMPSLHRGKYQTMNTLLPSVGAKLFLHVQPDLLNSLVQATLERDIASSASTFISALLTAYLKESANSGVTHQTMRPLWDSLIVQAVCSTNGKMRVNAADYLVPELLKFDNTAGPHLIQLIRNSVHCSGAELHCKLWGLVNVCLQARLMGLVGKDINFSGSSGGDAGNLLSKDELMAACLSEDHDLRLVSLTTLTVSLKTAAPVPPEELELLKSALVYSLKSPESDHRHKVTRVIKTLLNRMKESSRVQEKEVKKAEKALQGLQMEPQALVAAAADHQAKKSAAPASDSTKAAEPPVDVKAKTAECQAIIASGKQVMESFVQVCSWLRDTLLNNLYPGTSSDREVMALELVKCIFDTLGSTPSEAALYATHLACLNTPSMINTLLNLFISSWDRSRKMTADLLLRFPRPLPGYTNQSTVETLLKWGCTLAGSPRLRESDAGALLIRDVYTIYCLDLGWHLQIPSSFAVNHKPAKQPLSDLTAIGKQLVPSASDDSLENHLMTLDTKSARCALFMHSMTNELGDRLIKLDALFSTLNINELSEAAVSSGGGSDDVNMTLGSLSLADSIPLCHGLILAMKFCLLECKEAGMFSVLNTATEELKFSPIDGCSTGNNSSNIWQVIIRRVYRHCLLALESAMTIVAEAPSDVLFAPVPFVSMTENDSGEAALKALEGGDDTITTKGPVNSATMSATYINTNSIMGSGNNEETVDEKGSAVQRAVVAAWLLVKESCALLATLVSISPPLDVASESSETSAAATAGPADVDHAGKDAAGSSAGDRKRVRRSFKDSTSAGTSVATVGRVDLPLLTVPDVTEAGTTILEALGRLKHMGAIAEAHSALQSICATVLSHGERSLTLCRLPTVWLGEILARLEGEKQVFILRRSAGFAYSFLSLLRAEPSNCKPTLLPAAMSSLLTTIENGLVESSQTDTPGGGADSENSKWKLAVHALNVIRLILCDSAVGPDVDAFVAKATELAVRGFKSSRWGVRNSSMMVFSAVVQRAVDNDKNDSGGASASTAAEFFQRFPSLFPFLLQELADVTGFELDLVHGWPVGSHPKTSPTTTSASVSEKVYRGDESAGDTPTLYPLLLLISKLRAAMTNVLPTAADLSIKESEAAPTKKTTEEDFSHVSDASLFVPLIESCSPQKVQHVRVMAAKALAAVVPLQEVPGKVCSLLNSLSERIQLGPSANEIHGSLLLVQYLLAGLLRHTNASTSANKQFYSALQEELHAQGLPVLSRLTDLLRRCKCAPIQLALLRIIRTVRDLVQRLSAEHQRSAEALLLKESSIICSPFLIPSNGSSNSSKSSDATSAIVFPQLYEPVLWREALNDYTYLSLSVAVNSLPKLLELLDHSLSEVREGVLLGLMQVFDKTDPTTGRINSTHSIQNSELLNKLFNRAQAEVEPPIAQLTLDLLWRLTNEYPAGSDTFTEAAVLKGVGIVGHLVCKNWSTVLADPKVVLRTASSAYSALSVLGWLVNGYISTLSQCAGDAALHQLIPMWVKVLTAACSEDEPASLREAAANSILASNILHWLNHTLLSSKFVDHKNGHHLLGGLEVWILTTALMQDDDCDVREVANKVCTKASDSFRHLNKKGGDSVHLPAEFVCTESYTLDQVAVNIASVLTVATEESPEGSNLHQPFLNHFLSFVSNENHLYTLINGDANAISQKIFEAEQANLYIEPIKGAAVMASALAHSLAVLLQTSPAKGRAIALTVGGVVITKAKAALALLSRAVGKIDWIMGGATYEREVFQFVYLSLDMMRQFLLATQMLTKKSHHDCEDLCGRIERFYLQLDQVLKEIGVPIVNELVVEESAVQVLHPWIVKELNELLIIRIHSSVTCLVN